MADFVLKESCAVLRHPLLFSDYGTMSGNDLKFRRSHVVPELRPYSCYVAAFRHRCELPVQITALLLLHCFRGIYHPCRPARDPTHSQSSHCALVPPLRQVVVIVNMTLATCLDVMSFRFSLLI